jgi:hypothetical protein
MFAISFFIGTVFCFLKIWKGKKNFQNIWGKLSGKKQWSIITVSSSKSQKHNFERRVQFRKLRKCNLDIMNVKPMLNIYIYIYKWNYPLRIHLYKARYDDYMKSLKVYGKSFVKNINFSIHEWVLCHECIASHTSIEWSDDCTINRHECCDSRRSHLLRLGVTFPMFPKKRFSFKGPNFKPPENVRRNER